MKKISFLMVLLAAAVASGSAGAGMLPGTVQIGPFFNCFVTNQMSYPTQVVGIQYQYACRNPYTGATMTYAPFEACTYNCGLFPMAGQQFPGPSAWNCNVAFASCSAVTSP
jgi:hypothetical protein